MNTSIELKKGNGEIIKGELISYFEYVPTGKKYVFFTKNEKVDNELIKMYVSEVNNKESLSDQMTDEEWTNIKGVMKSILTGNTDTNIKYLLWEAK